MSHSHGLYLLGFPSTPLKNGLESASMIRFSASDGVFGKLPLLVLCSPKQTTNLLTVLTNGHLRRATIGIQPIEARYLQIALALTAGLAYFLALLQILLDSHMLPLVQSSPSF